MSAADPELQMDADEAYLAVFTSKDGAPKFKPRCELPLTGANVVDMLITDLAVFARPDRKSPFKLVERAPGVTADEIKAKTPAKFL